MCCGKKRVGGEGEENCGIKGSNRIKGYLVVKRCVTFGGKNQSLNDRRTSKRAARSVRVFRSNVVCLQHYGFLTVVKDVHDCSMVSLMFGDFSGLVER